MSHLRTASSRRRGLHASTISSSRLRMDTHGGPRGNSRGRSPRHKEIDRVMKKARSESGPQSSYWTKKLLEVEEKDPNSLFKQVKGTHLNGRCTVGRGMILENSIYSKFLQQVMKLLFHIRPQCLQHSHYDYYDIFTGYEQNAS